MTSNGEHKIEDIKNRLYEREDTVSSRKREGTLHQINYKVSNTWEKESEIDPDFNILKAKKPKKSIFKKFFILAIIFFMGAIGFATYMFLNNNVSVTSDNIDISVIGKAFTKGGDELPLQIEIANHNKSNLELVNLIVEYPRGAKDDSNDVIRLPKDTIGTIKPGENVVRNVKVVLFGEEKSIRDVKISLEYHPEGSNAIFTKEYDYPVTISSAPLSLIIDSPTEITSDQPISFKITATLNTSLPDDSTVLQVVYPNGFIFDNSSIPPTYGNSSWDLSKLTLTKPITIIINGKFVGQEGDRQALHVYAGSSNQNDKSAVNVVYNSLLQNITIIKPFLEAKVLVNGQDTLNPAIYDGKMVTVGISWMNNLPNLITDGQIIVDLSGNILDNASISANNGFYNSLNNQITWDKNTNNKLANIEPGASGIVEFSFNPISLIGVITDIKDPQVVVNVSIRGRQPSLGSTFSDVNNFVKKVIKMTTDFQIATLASYSSGSMPPKVGEETKYMVTWELLNSVNTINQAQAKAILPIYINWVGPQTGSTENMTYNEITREVIWNIGTVYPNTGLQYSREASFILSITPSLSQVGSVPQLMKDVFLSGQDSYTNITINDKRGPITTQLINNTNLVHENGRVIK